MGWFVIGVFSSFLFFGWAKFPSQKAELSSELVIVVVVPNGTKNENDVFFKNERKELFLFWNPKTYFQIQIWSWKEFRRKWPKRPLPTLFWSAALPSLLTHAAFAFTIIKIQLQGVKVSIIKLPINLLHIKITRT